jgi:hypothetical protein
MSARKIRSGKAFPEVKVQTRKSDFSVPTHAVCIRRNGIEFLSPSPISAWTEMTVELHDPADNRDLNCTGVVVSCSGSRHTGYHISVLFTGLSPQTQAHLSSLAYS